MSVQNNINNNSRQLSGNSSRQFEELNHEYYLWGPVKNGSRVYIVSVDMNFVAYYARATKNGELILDPRYSTLNPDIYVINNTANTKQLSITQEKNLYSVVGQLGNDNNLMATVSLKNLPPKDYEISSFTVFDPQNTVVVPSVGDVNFESQATNVDGTIESSFSMAGVPIILTGNKDILIFKQYQADPGNYQIGDGLDSKCFPTKIMVNDKGDPIISETKTVHFVPVDWYNLSQSSKKVTETEAFLYEQQWAISRYLNLNPSKAVDNACAIVNAVGGGGVEGFTYELMSRRGYKIDYCHGVQADCGTCLGSCPSGQICLVNSEGTWGCETVTPTGSVDGSIWTQPWFWAILIIGGILVLASFLLIVIGLYNYRKRPKMIKI